MTDSCTDRHFRPCPNSITPLRLSPTPRRISEYPLYRALFIAGSPEIHPLLFQAFRSSIFFPNLFQPFLSALIFHIFFVAVRLAIPVQRVCRMDRLCLLPQGREFGLTKRVIHRTIQSRGVIVSPRSLPDSRFGALFCHRDFSDTMLSGCECTGKVVSGGFCAG